MKLLLALIPLVSHFSEEESLKRISSHLVLNDLESAIQEAKGALEAYPESKPLKTAYIQALAKSGYTTQALGVWKELDDAKLLETVAWGFLEKGEHSNQLFVTLYSILGASQTQDVRAVKLILSQLRSTNAFLRSVGVKLAVQFRDASLINELREMIRKEKVWYVRLELYDALGKLGIQDMTSELREIVVSDTHMIEEQAVAAEALTQMLDEVDVNTFFVSKRAGLRYLACEIVSHLDMIDACENVAVLLSDTSHFVRLAALRTLTLLGEAKKYKEAIAQLAHDPHAEVGITAAWSLMSFDKKSAEQAFSKWLSSSDKTHRRIAAAAITKCGKSGQRLAFEALKSCDDPYTRATLAYGLIGQGCQQKLLCETIYTFLQTSQEKIMLSRSVNPHFQYIAPSEIIHSPHMAQYPSYVDQHTRLNLLNILAQKRFAKAEEATKTFLRENIDGLTYVACMTLLEEGETDAISLISELLGDEDIDIRVQAALVLALTSGDKRAIDVLQKVYPEVDRETKINILGALGHVGEQSSIPFLTAQLDEPFQLLRIIAASALIQCLYH